MRDGRGGRPAARGTEDGLVNAPCRSAGRESSVSEGLFVVADLHEAPDRPDRVRQAACRDETAQSQQHVFERERVFKR